MDKAEYKTKLEQINKLAEDGKFQEAARIADEIDWRHVKSVRTLAMIGEIYEANREYEESLRVLKYAYRRSSVSKTVLYRLAELDIKTGRYDEAKKFINEFEEISPNDTSRYILRYKLLRAEKAPYDDQIEVLRKYRDTEYTERWAYELAKLYNKNGQKEKCIEECDDMILWFNEGRFVQKALELKMSITELTSSQKAIYEANLKKLAEEEQEAERAAAEAAAAASEAEKPAEAEVLETAAEPEEGISKTDEDENSAEESGIESELSAAVSDEDDEESRPKVSAGEAITRMDTAAGITVGDHMEKAGDEEEDGGPYGEDDESREEIPEDEKEEKFQKRIMGSLRAMFKGMRMGGLKKEDSEDARDASEDEAELKEEEAPEEAPDAEETEVSSEETNGGEDGMTPGPEENAETAEEEVPEETEASEGGSEETEESAAEADVQAEAEEAPGETEVAEAAESAAEEEAFDLDRLFAETGSAFASEVASGNYVMADALKENWPEEGTDSADEVIPEEVMIPGADEIRNAVKVSAGETAARIARELGEAADTEIPESYGDEAVSAESPEAAESTEAAAKDAASEKETDAAQEERNRLYARETDESLGLTREFHFRDEIERAISRGEVSGESLPLDDISPEQAAKEAVIEAQGGLYGQEGESAAESLMQEEEETPEIPEEEEPEIPGEIPGIQMTDYPNSTEEAASDTGEIIDKIMETPEYLTPVPVEGRSLTEQEKKALSYFASIPGIDYQVTAAIADIHNNCGDRTSRSGNVLMMGRMGSGKTRLAEGLIRAVSMHLGLKAVRQAKIVAEEFNKKDPAAVIKKLAGGFLIIEAAGALDEDTVARLNQAMEFRTDDLIVILEDEKADLMKMLKKHPGFAEKFTSSITVPVFTNDELVSFGKICADEAGYKLDEMATLALYTMIGENQKDAEPVTVGQVRAMIDRAIEKSSRKFRFGRADRDEGRVVLHEKDFSF